MLARNSMDNMLKLAPDLIGVKRDQAIKKEATSNSGSSFQETVFDPDVIPDEFDIFYQDVKAFLPPGKKWEDLTPEEYAEVQRKYRFAPYRPGQYQRISGIGDCY